MEQKTAFFFSILVKFSWLGNWLFLFIALTECIPFLGSIFPGGTLIFIAGILAAQGYFDVWDVLIFATLGAIIGDYSGYALGRWGGNWLRRKKIIRAELIIKGEEFFNKYGAPSIFWGRFIGATRAVVPFIAGSTRLKPRIFFFWNLIGAIGWALTHVVLGYFSGNIIAIVIRKWSGRLSLILLILVGLGLMYWLIKKHHQNIRHYFIKASQKFAEKLSAQSWFKKITNHYPVASEFIQTKISQEKIFGGLVGAILLFLLYILVLLLDFI